MVKMTAAGDWGVISRGRGPTLLHCHCLTLSSHRFFWGVLLALLVILPFCSQQSKSAHMLLKVLIS